jgi:hypothetical protein
MGFEVITMKQQLARTALVLVILAILPCVGLFASGWDAGDYWVWQGSMEQSPSFTTTTTIYVLQSTRVLYRYELDVLGQVFHANSQTTVTLGTVLRHLGGLTTKGYNSMFQDAARWASLPQGAQAEENCQIPDYPFGTASSKQITVMQDACVDADVPAGKFVCCKKMLIIDHSENHNSVFDRKRVIWFSPELGWPVRTEQYSDLATESYQLVNELVELGHVSSEEAALRILSVIDEMKDHSWANPDTIFILREQLLSLGLLPDSAP